ncbi:MAG: serine hydrolase [Ruminococcaceae bacterium]|nr:serine hydrolase [Oscillospiraceae bacterium]
MFERITPEAAGIPSEKVLRFVRMLDDYNFATHSLIMARGDKIFAEAYWAPFDAKFNHRMYSVSKSFVAIAVGMAIEDGLLSLDDKFMKFFPEYMEQADDALREATVRDMLMMRSSMTTYHDYWWKDGSDRTAAYFTQKSSKLPGTLYHYDSAASYMMNVVVEKLTGKEFLEYMKEKVLLDMGFSKESYTLHVPGGHTIGDSGVMCTARDLLIFAKFVLNGGVWKGKRYVSESFMRDAVSKLTDNRVDSSLGLHNHNGYGYYIWTTRNGGFSFVGMGDQLMFCDPEKEFIFVITSDNQGSEAVTRALITHELYSNIIPSLGDALPEDPAASDALAAYLDSRTLICEKGAYESPLKEAIDGVTYTLEDNAMGVSDFTVRFDENGGTLTYTVRGAEKRIPFGFGANRPGKLPNDKRFGLTAAWYEDGAYEGVASACFPEPDKLRIRMQMVDTYFGGLVWTLCFKDERVTYNVKKTGSRVLDGIAGIAMGKKK